MGGVAAAAAPALMQALRREAALQSSLAHEHVVRVYGLAEGVAGGGKLGLVMARMHTTLQVGRARMRMHDGAQGGMAVGVGVIGQVPRGRRCDRSRLCSS